MFGRTELLFYGIVTFSVLAAGFDLVWGRIFNWLTVAGFVLGLGAATFVYGWPGFLGGLAGALLGLVAYGWMLPLGVMGGGDVKLLMALGAWGGAEFTLKVALLGVLLGGALAALILLYKGRLLGFARKMFRFAQSVMVKELEVEKPAIDRSMTMPFGVPIAAAAIWIAASDPFVKWGIRLWN